MIRITPIVKMSLPPTAMDLDRFKADHWWNVVAAMGGLIAVAAVPERFVAAFLIGLGLLSFGIGEWINRAQRAEIVVRSVVVSIHPKPAGNPWKPRFHGIILDALGIGLFAIGVFWLFALPGVL
jgi:hypothetical protein